MYKRQISNSAKPARSGEVTLTLERRGGQALLWLGDRGEGGCLDALSPPKEAGARIPAPGDGAGMGLSLIHILNGNGTGCFLHKIRLIPAV